MDIEQEIKGSDVEWSQGASGCRMAIGTDGFYADKPETVVAMALESMRRKAVYFMKSGQECFDEVMSANRILKSERDAARSEVERLASRLIEAKALRSERDDARRERNEARAERDRWMGKAQEALEATRLACELAEVEQGGTVAGSLDNIINRLRAALSDVSKLEAERDEVAAAVEHLVAFADDPSHPAYKAAEECRSLTAGRIEASIEALRMERDCNARLSDEIQARNDRACAVAEELGLAADHHEQALGVLKGALERTRESRERASARLAEVLEKLEAGRAEARRAAGIIHDQEMALANLGQLRTQADARVDRLIGIVERLTSALARRTVEPSRQTSPGTESWAEPGHQGESLTEATA